MRVRYVETAGASWTLRDEALAFLGGGSANGIEAPQTLVPPPRPLTPMPRMLARGAATDPDMRAGLPPPPSGRLAQQAAGRLQRYHMQLPRMEPYRVGTGHEMRIELRMDPSLVAAGLAWTAGHWDVSGSGERPWDLQLEVDVGENGRVRGVLVLGGSAPPAVQREWVRRMYLAEATPGAAAVGRLTLRWGRVATDGSAPAVKIGP